MNAFPGLDHSAIQSDGGDAVQSDEDADYAFRSLDSEAEWVPDSSECESDTFEFPLLQDSGNYATAFGGILRSSCVCFHVLWAEPTHG
jgi:hypothetical protein